MAWPQLFWHRSQLLVYICTIVPLCKCLTGRCDHTGLWWSFCLSYAEQWRFKPLIDLERHGAPLNQQAEVVDDTGTLFLCVLMLTRCVHRRRSKQSPHVKKKWPSADKNRSYWSWLTEQASRQRSLYLNALLLFVVLTKFLTCHWNDRLLYVHIVQWSRGFPTAW